MKDVIKLSITDEIKFVIAAPFNPNFGIRIIFKIIVRNKITDTKIAFNFCLPIMFKMTPFEHVKQ